MIGFRSWLRHSEWEIDNIARKSRIFWANKRAFDFVVGLARDMEDVCNQPKTVDTLRGRILLNELTQRQLEYWQLAKAIGEGFDAEEDE